MSKNIQSKISDLLTPYANEMDDERLAVFLSVSIGRILLKQAIKNSENSIEIDKNDIRHITDWLKASIINNEAWINNINDQRLPKKFMKFSTIEQVVKEADKAMTIANQKISNIKLIEGDEELFVELQDGYYIVKLLTPAALDKESAQMQHCIGQGAYDEFLKNENALFLSLRNPAGKAHVTMEIDYETIVQIQGKQNQKPVKKYMDMIIPYLKSQKYRTDIPYESIGYLVDIDRNWYKINEIPEGAAFPGNVDLGFISVKDFPEFENFELPDNLTVYGDLDLKETNITRLPRGLIVHQTLNISNTKIQELPHDLKVAALIADGSDIHEIPDTIQISSGISINDTAVLEIPDNFNCMSFISAKNSLLTKLPNDLDLDNLDISDTYVENLPAKLNIYDTLNIQRTKIKNIPENTYVGQDLNAYDSSLETISKGCKIDYSLTITGSYVKELPDDIKIGSSLLFEEDQLTHLPESLSDDLQIYIQNKRTIFFRDNQEITTAGNFRNRFKNTP